MAVDALRQEKNLIICTATLVTRAAIRGGLDKATAFSLSDAYIQRAELMEDCTGLLLLNIHMVEEFTKRVADVQSGGGSSQLVRVVREYILLHLDKSITTDELSRISGMNRTYFCKRFQEEIGMTVNHYVTVVKMDEAKRGGYQEKLGGNCRKAGLFLSELLSAGIQKSDGHDTGRVPQKANSSGRGRALIRPLPLFFFIMRPPPAG